MSRMFTDNAWISIILILALVQLLRTLRLGAYLQSDARYSPSTKSCVIVRGFVGGDEG
jgi:hypothetical protein